MPRPPPRPSPGSIIYSEEEESKHYEDVHRRDLTDVAESSSLTEKSDLQSHSDSQVRKLWTQSIHLCVLQ